MYDDHWIRNAHTHDSVYEKQWECTQVLNWMQTMKDSQTDGKKEEEKKK